MSRAEQIGEVAFERMTALDFVIGILHYKALQGYDRKYVFNINDPAFHEAFSKAQEALCDREGAEDPKVTFRIKPHPVHGDSPTLRNELDYLFFHVGRGFVEGYRGSYVNLVYDAGHPLAESIVEHTTGTPELFQDLVQVFDEAYDNYQRGTI